MKHSGARENMARSLSSSKIIPRGISARSRAVPKKITGFGRGEMPVVNTNSARKVERRTAVTTRETPTSRSSCSSSVMVLEETIADVMGVRMQSLNDLSARVEELSTLHRQEEEAFRQQMNGVLQQLEAARAIQLDTEQDFEALLQKERFERQLIMSMMQRFKTEGAKVIETMKKSLNEAKLKWKAEVERNANLTAQLRRCQKNGTSQGAETGGTEQSILKQGGCELNDKIKILTRLLEEEDGIIVELQQRNKALEKKVAILTQQRDSLLNLESQNVGSEEFNREYVDLLKTVQDTGINKNEINLERKLEAFACFTKMLLQRLQAEQRQRLHVEEQIVHMASEHEQAVRVLEARIKCSEGQKNGCAPFRSQGVFLADTEKIPANLSNPLVSRISTHTEEAARLCECSTSEDATKTKKDDDDDDDAVRGACVVEIHTVELEHEEPMSNDPAKYVEHAALEDQLTTITRNFQQAVEEWKTSSLEDKKSA